MEMPSVLLLSSVFLLGHRCAASSKGRILLALPVALVLCFVTGCGSTNVETVPVYGEVFAGDTPAVGALVVLHLNQVDTESIWRHGSRTDSCQAVASSSV